ncbi:glycosyltransferase family 4 protein [Flavobacterium sp. FZUC8N2.13]|uniref:Glycosyltransferase family 4 protein n=1 Tax=Flavobacterium zubiriense TaxID=3138075 RepID=A0ABV4TBR6_9FLAO
MKVIYTAPNRAHHYRYASSLNKANFLLVFVSGFPRLSPRAKITELKQKLYRADILQTIYLLSLKIRASKKTSNYLAYLAKIEQDFACKKFLKRADVFVFYNGNGLSSCNYANKMGKITVVEVVNSHVEYQEDLLREEHESLNLPWKPFHKKDKERRLKEYAAADYILLPSEFVKQSFLAKGFPEEKLLKVPYGYTIPVHEANTEGKAHTTFNVLYVGSISVRKGIRYLIEAFKKLETPNKKLIIVGPVDQISGIEGIEITDDIEFTGILKGTQLEKIYQWADVFCLPTIEDGYGLVLGEALSYGLPLITTTNSGGIDLITEGIEGFIVPIRDATAIHEKLKLLSSDNKLLDKMKLAALSKAASMNGWDTTGIILCEKLETVFLKNKNN